VPVKTAEQQAALMLVKRKRSLEGLCLSV